MHFLKSRVFLGWVLGILWSEVVNNFAVPKIHVFLGPNLRVLWSEVTNNFALPEIRVLGELSCWSRNLERVPNFVPFCYWKGAKFA